MPLHLPVKYKVLTDLQEESEVKTAMEQMCAAVTTLNSAVRSTPLSPADADQLRHICRQLETLISTS